MINATVDRTLARDYFADTIDAFDRAARRVPRLTRDCAVAGTAVRLHFAGDAMVPVAFRAIAHLQTPALPAGPRLDLYVWDSASTGEAMPPPTWPLEAYGERGEIRVFRDEGLRATFTADGPIVDLWDPASNRAVMWARDHAAVRSYERSTPCRRILFWWLSHRGRALIHAGAVGAEGGAVLLAGWGGSGKSNAALSSLGAGLDYLADDYCAIEPAADPVVHSLYNTGKVEGRDLVRLPFLDGRVTNASQLPFEKALFFFDDALGARVRRRADLRAIVLPHVDTRIATRLRPAAPGDAVRAIATSTIGQIACAGREVLQRVAAIARQRPVFHLDVGHDAPARVPALLRRLAAGEGGGRADD
jgi:hypothetical protein